MLANKIMIQNLVFVELLQFVSTRAAVISPSCIQYWALCLVSYDHMSASVRAIATVLCTT